MVGVNIFLINLQNFVKKNKIIKQNGVAKHKKKPLVENVRSMKNFVKF
jgi:hypothetical protein